MIYRVILLANIVLVFATALLGQSLLDVPLRPDIRPRWQCRRIVSMAPSITETLYALGLGDNVVGVTRYCEYPPEVQQKPRIGGYYDPNFEAILALQPDLVILLDGHENWLPAMQQLGLETLVVSHRTIEDIIYSFRRIGRVCGRGPQGRQMVADYENRLNRLYELTKDASRPSVLFVLDRTFGQGRITDAFVAGDEGYFERIIDLAGGRNACQEKLVRNPIVSSESIIAMNPDVIVDLVPKELLETYKREELLKDWNSLPQVSAVKNKRIVMFDTNYACVPGPRFINLIEDLVAILHPEISLEE